MSTDQNILAPFKPFTLGEAAAITGIPFLSLDEMIRSGLLPLRTGDDGETTGLDVTGLFAAFVAAKWQAEGADQHRLISLVNFVVDCGYEHLMREVAGGHSMPDLSSGMMVGTPKSRLGIALNFYNLGGQFRRALEKAFPKRTTIVTPGENN